MLVIRMQRTGRKGLAQYRVVVQDSRQTPTSGKFVAALGHYDPHSKTHGVDLEKAKFYLEHGAQPSNRVARLLNSEGVKLPEWVNLETGKKKSIKNSDKLRKNRPAEEAPVAEEAPEPAEAPEATPEETPTAEVAEEPVAKEPEAPAEETPAAEEPAKEEAPAAENAEEPATEEAK